MRLFSITLLTLLLASCNNQPTNEGSNKTAVTEKDSNSVKLIEKSEPSPVIEHCYWKIKGRDTLALQLFEKDNEVEGKINFDNYQIDGSSGPVTGAVDGNIIKLWYKFKAEGTNNVMQIYFKREGTRLFRGSGPYTASGDSSFYKDESNVTYDMDTPFLQVLCDSVPQKYKQ